MQEAEDFTEDAQDWEALLLSRLNDMPSDAFERLSQRMLLEAGFQNVEVTDRSGDGGNDCRVGVYRLMRAGENERWKHIWTLDLPET